MLRAYLLGMLPEEETERLDELSVTEDQFAQNLLIAEDDLIDAYVNGELTGSELLQFPKQYLQSLDQVERVRFAKGFQSINRTGHEPVKKKIKAPSAQSVFSFLNFGNWKPWKWGLVAGGLLFLIASWFIVQQLRKPRQQTPPQTTAVIPQEPRLPQESGSPTATAKSDEQPPVQPSIIQQTNRPNPSRIVAFVLKPQMRSISEPPELTIPIDASTIAFTLQLEPSDTDYYRTIVVEAAGDRTVWAGAKVKATTKYDLAFLQIRVPAGLLKQQAYKIRTLGIYPNGATEMTNEYSFRVVR